MAYKYRVSQSCQEWAIGQQWTFSRFTRRVWQDFAEYGRKLLPDPLAVALGVIKTATLLDAQTLRDLLQQDAKEIEAAKKEDRIPALVANKFRQIADVLAEKAMQKATSYLDAQSPELSRLMSSPEGGGYLFYLLLNPRRHDNPPVIDVSEEQAFDIYWDLEKNEGEDGRKTVEQIIRTCNGTAPEPEKNDSPPAA